MANLEKIDKKEAIMVVDFYINNQYSAKEAAYELGITEYRLRKCLKAAVNNKWISSEKIEELKKRVVSHQGKRGPKSERIMASYQDKEEIRDAIRPLKAERMNLLFRIEEFKTCNDEEQLKAAYRRLQEIEELIEEYQNKLNLYKRPRRKK